MKKNNNQETREMQYLPIGMCIGLSVGMAIGSALGSIPIGMCMGLSIGLCFGAVMDSKKKKAEDDSAPNDEKEKAD